MRPELSRQTITESAPDVPHDEVAGLGQLRLVSEKHPGAPEDPLHLDRV